MYKYFNYNDLAVVEADLSAFFYYEMEGRLNWEAFSLDQFCSSVVAQGPFLHGWVSGALYCYVLICTLGTVCICLVNSSFLNGRKYLPVHFKQILPSKYMLTS